MTTGELVKHFSGNGRLATAIDSHFAEARLFGFIEKNEASRWSATPRASAFLRGEISVFKHCWPRDEELPEACCDEELVSINDITSEAFDDPGRHLDHSVVVSGPR